MVNYETALGLTIFVCLGYYLQTGPQIGDFLPQSKVDQFEEDGIVIVDDLFSPEQLEKISSELMLRVNNRAAGVRAEDLLNLHFNDSFILSEREDSGEPVVTLCISRPGPPPQRSVRSLAAPQLPEAETVRQPDPLQAARRESGDSLAPGQRLLASLANEGRQCLGGPGRRDGGERGHGHVQVLRPPAVPGSQYRGGEGGGDWSGLLHQGEPRDSSTGESNQNGTQARPGRVP